MRRLLLAACVLPAFTCAQEPPAGTISGAGLKAILAPSGDVVARVGREFAAFDSDYSGELEQREFVRWVTQLRLSERAASGSPVDEAAARRWATEALTVADMDGSGGVSQSEFVAFLGGDGS